MKEDTMLDMIVKLSNSVNELEYSVMQAYDSFLSKYGAGHKHINRLESYFPAIDKQREYIDELELLVKEKNFSAVYEVSNKVVALSEMIKNDARSFLISLSSENFDESTSETVH